MRLELDLGNSFIKWRIAEQPESRGQLPVDNLGELVVALKNITPTEVYVGSVAGSQIDRVLLDLCQASWGVEPEYALVSDQNAFGLRPGYQYSDQLGIDRWLAVLAAYQCFSGDLLVVDVGSAITIDELRGGEHLGGYILPGIHLMQSSLLGRTAKVRFDQLQDQDLKPGKTTSECVAAGIELLLAGLVVQLESWVSAAQSLRLVVTGGGAQRLIRHFPETLSYEYQSDLVFDGLKYVERGRL